MTDQTVPDELLGCWQRRWIEFADGNRDDTSFVVWLQLPSLMADVRLSGPALGLAGRRSIAELSNDELLLLADSDSSSGATTCTPVVVGANGVSHATAEWAGIVSFQPISAYPEPGLLEWIGDGTVLVERAPSGAYVEEWHLLPGSRGPLVHTVLADGSEWYLRRRCRRAGARPSVSVARRSAPGRHRRPRHAGDGSRLRVLVRAPHRWVVDDRGLDAALEGRHHRLIQSDAADHPPGPPSRRAPTSGPRRSTACVGSR
ncbi:MAG: hypothetical protein IPP16_03705 [Acidimicrobiaceae bacterium]|nr:hypothetical protein [Acidimicrobiaceae bacterium]